MAITIEDLLEKVSKYHIEGLPKIREAYNVASTAHANQFRESGEPYIVHPLEVAYILAENYMDTDTIVAGLLHDVIEDTYLTKEDLQELFGNDVANLVDGVTNFNKIDFSNREARKLANNHKVALGIIKDIRIYFIKLADRLHNMRTLEYKKRESQIEISLLTLEMYAPIADKLGFNRLKNELEDLSFKYLKPRDYKKTLNQVAREQEKDSYKNCITEMLGKINAILSNRSIPNEVKVRTKNLYRIYKDLATNPDMRLSTMHDLISIKIMVDQIDNCYLMLRPVHELYKPVDGTFKDYICNPKPNKYSSLHTTVYGPYDRRIQIQLKTFKMGEVASFGLARNWDISQKEGRLALQQYVKEKYPFHKSIAELNKAYGKDDREFINHLKEELTTITVVNSDGKEYELPLGSTLIDFAYALGEEVGNNFAIAKVNDKIEEMDYVLKDKDSVRIQTNAIVKPTEEWLSIAKTARAKNLILQYVKNVH